MTEEENLESYSSEELYELLSRYAQRTYPRPYPYGEVAGTFLWAANQRGLDLDERLRALADVFEVITYKPVHEEDRLESRRQAWLTFGYIIEVTEGGNDGIPPILTKEEREEAKAIVSTISRNIG